MGKHIKYTYQIYTMTLEKELEFNLGELLNHYISLHGIQKIIDIRMRNITEKKIRFPSNNIRNTRSVLKQLGLKYDRWNLRLIENECINDFIDDIKGQAWFYMRKYHPKMYDKVLVIGDRTDIDIPEIVVNYIDNYHLSARFELNKLEDCDILNCRQEDYFFDDLYMM